MQNGVATMKNSMEVLPQILTTTTIYDPAIPLLGIYQKKKIEIRILKRHLYAPVHCSIIRKSQDTETS